MYVSAGHGLALLRMAFGLYFISYALDKTMNGWLGSAGPMTAFLFGNPNATPPTRGAVVNSTPFYADFLTNAVQPSPLLFSQLVVVGEWVCGDPASARPADPVRLDRRHYPEPQLRLSEGAARRTVARSTGSSSPARSSSCWRRPGWSGAWTERCGSNWRGTR